MSQTDQNLLLIGSQYPQSLQNELVQTASEIGLKIIPSSIGSFKSGERFCELYPGLKEQFEENQTEIEGANVHVVMNMEEDPNLVMIDAINIAETLKEYGAAHVHLILSFAPFARQDRAFDNRMVSIMGKTFPKHLRYAGVDQITTFDMHSKAAEKFYVDYFGDDVRFLSALGEIYKVVQKTENTKYAAPDGFDKPNDIAQGKARNLAHMGFGDNCDLAEHMIGLKKVHTGPSTVEVTKAAGDAKDSDVILIDDMGDTLGTIKEAAAVTKEEGAVSNTAVFTHALLSDNSLEIMTSKTINGKTNPVDRLVFTNSILSVYNKVAALPEEQKTHVEIVSVLPLIKQALILAA